MAKKSKIYKVPVKFCIYVVAKDKEQAKQIAEKYAYQELEQDIKFVLKDNIIKEPERIYNIKQIKKDDRHSLPWTDDCEEKEIIDWLK